MKHHNIIDCFLFFNEVDLLEYRLKHLWDVVDYFIISESAYTFVGNEKPYFPDDPRYERYRSKIISIHNDKIPHSEPNFENQEQWINENFQRDSLIKGIQQLLDEDKISENDIFLINDVDEIPDPVFLYSLLETENLEQDVLYVLRQKYHCYNLSIIRHLDWYHPKALSIKTWKATLQNESFSKIRMYGITEPFPDTIKPQLINQGGWHLSYFGDVNFITSKLNNFSHQEFNVSLEEIQSRMQNGTDIMGRDFITYENIPTSKNTYLPPDPFFL